MTEIAVSPARARELTDRIKIAVDATWALITEAYTTRAWAALGYDSWDAYCAEEFGAARLKLPREERQEVVGSLRDAGLSIRAIASATGSSKTTVTGDLSQIGTPDTTTGTDGRSYSARGYEPTDNSARFDMGEFWEPSADAPAPLPDRQDAADSAAAAIEKQVTKPRAPRTDVVGTVSALLTKTEDAASLAGRITSDHMAQRSEEAAVWSRRLETALEPLQRLLNTFKENQ
ncbi:hypothetical protein GCM10023224_05390 [Streptomonospora halophila]|uniref:Homeodomain-like domain-containing protein n=1 Tax=Streptomonospora halophila TaxID=427369 RepID=A0ABP9G5L6_9ACTN